MSIRSIGCFGFKKIDLVNPRNFWPNEKGLNSSKHFTSIARRVKIFSTIPEAIKKSDLVIATTVRQRDIKIPQIEIDDIKNIKAKKNNHLGESSTILDKDFTIACKEGAILPLFIQREGKKVVSLEDFLRGFTFSMHDKLNA